MKYVIISGATGGIGFAFCKNQVLQGENVIAIGRSQDKLNKLKSDLLSLNSSVDVVTFTCDLSSSEDRLKLFSAIRESNLELKRLINVAGVDTQMAFERYTQDKILFQTRVNFESVVSLTKFCLELNSEDLEILTVSSSCGLTPMPYFALYSATKCALINFFDALRYEYKKTKVKITTLTPGSVPTRPDIIEDIKKQGLTGKFSSKSPDYVVKKGLKALANNKRRCIPGLYNKFVCFLAKITPYGVQAKIISRKFSNKQKDAF